MNQMQELLYIDQQLMGKDHSKGLFEEQKIIYNEGLFCIEKQELGYLLHRSIGAFTFINSQKNSCAGSGVLISRNLVLTVAHNIYDKGEAVSQKIKDQNKLNRFELNKLDYKFYIGGVLGEAYHEIQDWRYLPAYRTCDQNKRLSADFALVKLKKCVQFDQFLQISIACLECLNQNSQELQIFGYPLYKQNYACLDKRGQKIKLSQYGLTRKNRIKHFSPEEGRIGYAISTLSGHSGSPVVNNAKIIAIHNGGGGPGEQFNVGRLMTRDLIETLARWKDELNGDPFKIAASCPHLPQPKADQVVDLTNMVLQDVFQSQKIDFNGEGLKHIDLRKYVSLKFLNLSSNKIAKIDLRSSPLLEKVWLMYNPISELDLSKNPNLSELYLRCNNISALQLNKNPNIRVLNVQSNQLAAIDTTNMPNLEKLYLWSNKLTKLDLSRNKQLKKLSVSCNLLTHLDASYNSNLNYLSIYENKLQSTTFWAVPQLSLQKASIKLGNQNSPNCELILLYNKYQLQMCMKLAQELEEQYKGTKILSKLNYEQHINKYKCEYVFIMKAI